MISFEEKCGNSVLAELFRKGRKYYPYLCTFEDKVIPLKHETDPDEKYEHAIFFRMIGEAKHFPKKHEVNLPTCFRDGDSLSSASYFAKGVVDYIQNHSSFGVKEIFIEYEEKDSKFRVHSKSEE